LISVMRASIWVRLVESQARLWIEQIKARRPHRSVRGRHYSVKTCSGLGKPFRVSRACKGE
jgi:hypothetical protein